MKKLLLFVIVLLLIFLSVSSGLFYDRIYSQKPQHQPVTAGSAINQPSLQASANTSPVVEQSLSDVSIHVTSGFDWSLPTSAHASHQSGLIDEAHPVEVDYVRHHFLTMTWKAMQPEPDVYYFSKLERALKQHRNQRFVIRLEVNSACEAPAWLLQHVRATSKHSLVFWDQAYADYLKPLIAQFATRFAGNERIAGVYLGLGDGEYHGDCKDFSNKAGWGEFWMSPDELAEAETHFGLTPDKLLAATKTIIDDYVQAFGRYRYKLAFTNFEPFFTWGKRAPAYDPVIPKVATYAFNAGTGNRDGEVENWLRFIDKNMGMTLIQHKDGRCSLGMSDNFEHKIQGRYWGTENEFYGNVPWVIQDDGPYYNQPYRFYISSLRALQMRRNFVTIYGNGMRKLDDPVYRTQDFLRYLDKTLGKTVADTSDAFVVFGERYSRPERLPDFQQHACVKGQDKVVIRSFGRWLREFGDSHPAMKINMPADEQYWGQKIYLPYDIDYEYAARKGTAFNLELDERVVKHRCQHGCSIMVKLTLLDNDQANVFLESFSQTTETQQRFYTGAYKTKGDTKIKTLSFGFNKPAGMFFDTAELSVISDQPVTLIMARVILD